MQGKKLLHSIRLTNLLSYGSEGVSLDLEPLNVLIGPNGSGKSNLIEAISLLAAAPRDILAPFREGGGAFEDWLWKGESELPTATIEVVLEDSRTHRANSLLSYSLSFTVSDVHLQIVGEELKSGEREFLVRDSLNVRMPPAFAEEVVIEPKSRQQSVLSQVRGPLIFPQITYVSYQLLSIRFFSEWNLGPRSSLRKPQGVNLPDDFLLWDASNLGLVLNDLQNRLDTKHQILERMREFYPNIQDVTTRVQGGTIRIFIHESGLKTPVPAACLSDGTLHYLCLLTILLHPEPPPLICIEEPELGLHPDILPKVADLLIDASQRTQLIVTTHSETLVSRLSEIPEAVVVCERDERGTNLRRLEPEKLRAWLDKYMLGELWRMGEIGGNRW